MIQLYGCGAALGPSTCPVLAAPGAHGVCQALWPPVAWHLQVSHAAECLLLHHTCNINRCKMQAMDFFFFPNFFAVQVLFCKQAYCEVRRRDCSRVTLK